jgi:tetratricopeptide (TPR) repeat protein
MKGTALLSALLLVGIGRPALAQQDSLLQETVRLMIEGQGDSARALVRNRLASLSTFDSLYPGALYASGVVAEDTTTALNAFRRVSIEYSGSEWADDALLRLAQLNYAAGQYAPALRSVERVILDYPFSDVSSEARFWAGRARLAMGEVLQACEHFQAVVDSNDEDVELVNRARYALLRCSSLTAQTADSAAAPAPPRTGRVFSVQVAAVQTAGAADEVMRSLGAQGYQPHVIRDTDGLLKIRVGRFARRAEAQRLVTELRRKIGGRPFIVEEL